MAITNLVIQKIIEIGPVIIIPSILFLLGLLTITNPLKNLLNCIYVFIGMLGISIMLTLFIRFFTPLIDMILSNSPKEFLVIDAGIKAPIEIILNCPINLYIVIALVSINLIMLFLRLTRTINIDLWNWWILMMAGSMVFAITEIKWLGVLITVIIYSVSLAISDIYAPYLEQYYGLPGVSTPQTQYIAWAPVTHLVNYILNKIPLVKKAHIFYEEIRYKLGFFSEPMIIGFLLGFILGAVTRFRTLIVTPQQDLLFACKKGLELSIIMILLPRFVNLLYRGLSPAVRNIMRFINKKITKREMYLGVDTIIFAVHPSIIGLSVILIPLSVYIATILPGNNILPGPDLIIIPFFLVWAISPSRGDIFRSFISSIIIIPLTLWIASDMGSFFTSFFNKYNIEISEGINSISSYSGGSNWLFWIILQIIKPILDLFS